MIWGRKWLICGVVAVVVTAVAAWTFRQAPTYSAYASLIVDQQMPQVLGNRVREVVDISPHAYRDTQHYMQTQVTVACSTRVAEIAARQLNLHRIDNFWPTEMPAGKRTLRVASEWLRSMASCSSRRKASIIDIAVQHGDPKLAAQMASAMAQAYMDNNLEHKQSSTTGAVRWLAKQLETLKKKLEDAEGKLYKFRKDNGLISLTIADRRSMNAQRLTSLNSELSAAHSALIKASAELELLNSVSTDNPQSVPVMNQLRTRTIDHLKLALIAAKNHHSELSKRYGPKHPQVVAQRAKLEEARSSLAGEIKNVIAGAHKRLQKARRTEVMLAGAIKKTKADAFEVNKKVMTYNRLERNAKSAERMYHLVLGRMTESDLSGRLRVNNVRLLESAKIPFSPIRPRTRLNILLGFLLGLLGGIGLVFLIEALDRSVIGEDDVSAAGMIYLGSMPRIEGVVANKRRWKRNDDTSRELIAHNYPRSRAAEDCRAIRTNLLFASPDQQLRRIVVSSAAPDEGKTLFATTLALTIAQQGTRVLLIDADLRRPRLDKVFNVGGNEGLSTALRADSALDASSLEKLLRSTHDPNLKLMPAGLLPPNPADLCHSERFKRLLELLNEQFDMIIIDTPPVMPVTDAVVLSTYCDGTILVSRAGRTVKAGLRQCCQRLTDVGARVLGGVINDLDQTATHYRYRYAGSPARYAAAYGAEQIETPPAKQG